MSQPLQQRNYQSVQKTTTTAQLTTYEVAGHVGGFAPQSHKHNHSAGGGLNCPCCNERIVGEIASNESNYVELQEVKTMVKEKIVPSVVSNKVFVPNKNTQYCSIPGCTVCEGMFRMKEQTDRKVIIHREVSHACDFQCKFCEFNAADERLLQLIEEHHVKKAQLKMSAAASLQDISQSNIQQQQQQLQQQASETQSQYYQSQSQQQDQQQYFDGAAHQQQYQGDYYSNNDDQNFMYQQGETVSVNETSRLSIGSQRI